MRNVDPQQDGKGTQTPADPFHLLEGGCSRDGCRSLLDDLLVPPLDGAVSAEQRDSVPVFIGKNLNLEVSRVLSQLHDEDRRAGNLRLNLHTQKKKPSALI